MEIVERHRSNDGITTKYVLRSGSALIECTHVNRSEKHIICFTTAIGCPIACLFCCAPAFSRRLTAHEMVAQCLTVEREARASDPSKRTLFSAMGEGEPLLNKEAAFELVKAATELLVAVPDSRFAVSTTGVKPELIRWLADQIEPATLKLQVSVHGATDGRRAELIPVAAPVMDVIEAGAYYERRHPGNVEWNYVLVDGLNDSESDSRALGNLLGSGRAVKLNRLNPVPHRNLQPSRRARDFGRELERFGLSVEHYVTDGSDVAAACGQLRSRSLMTRSMTSTNDDRIRSSPVITSIR